MDLNFEMQFDVAVVSIVGRLDASNASTLKEMFKGCVDKASKFVLDLENTTGLDSTGLGAIVTCLKYVSEVNGEMKLAAIKEKPMMVFQITRAYRIFEIYDTIDEALESFGVFGELTKQ